MKTYPVVFGVLAIWVGVVAARPGHFYYSFPAPSQHTTVLRDALGNQATAYSYQDGHSSSVAVSRNDVSKHLAYVPAPVAYHQPLEYAHAPIVYDHQPYVAASPYHHLPSSYYDSYYL